MTTMTSTTSTTTTTTTSFDEILDRVCEFRDRNYFVTGQAGTGKTKLVNDCNQRMSSVGYKTLLTSTTGVSAVNVGNGCATLHSALGIGLGADSPRQMALNAKTRSVVNSIDVLIIDEISLLPATLFAKLDVAFRLIRNETTKSFGGVKLIVVGDFLQLPPVNDDFCFRTTAWTDAKFASHVLSIVFRQNRDERFVAMLSRFRVGKPTERDIAALNETSIAVNNLSSRLVDDNGDDDVTNLYCTNVRVDGINDGKLASLRQPVTVFAASYFPTTSRNKFKGIVADKIQLCVGARVMLVVNLQVQNNLVNGSVGRVTSFSDDGYPVVKFIDGPVICVRRYEWKITRDEKAVATCSQIPLKLAYALTVHKSQGCTLTSGKIDLANAFEYGQAYVALSRFKSLDGLVVRNATINCFKAHPDATRFYDNLSIE